MQAMARKGYLYLTYLFLLGIVVQVFLARAGIFGDFPAGEEGTDLDPHRAFSFMVMHLIPIIMFVLALVGRMGKVIIGLTVALFLMVFLQVFWIEADSRWVKAIHPTMTLFMLGTAHYLAQETRKMVRGAA